VVSEYRKANAVIRPTPATARIWVSLHREIEKVRDRARARRRPPSLPHATRASTGPPPPPPPLCPPLPEPPLTLS